jgi:hypothetical protein
MKTHVDPIHSDRQCRILRRQLRLATIEVAETVFDLTDVVLHRVQSTIDPTQPLENEVFNVCGHKLRYSAARSAPRLSASAEHAAMIGEDRAIALVR